MYKFNSIENLISHFSTMEYIRLEFILKLHSQKYDHLDG